MRLDEALLEHAVRAERSLPLLRIYGWKRKTLSVGHHQKLSEELLERCTSLHVEVVRRPTGGSAVLHGADVTYALVAPDNGMGVLEAYRWVATGLIEGLALLGIEAHVGGTSGRHGGLTSEVPSSLGPDAACFTTMVGADLRVGEKKICGSAQLRRKGWFLQHGSIPLLDGSVPTRRILRHPGPNRSTCLEHLRPGTTFSEVRHCLIEGFVRRWGAAEQVTSQELLSPVDLPVRTGLT